MEQTKTASFLDRMPADKRKKYEDRANKRLEQQYSKKNLDVPPEFYNAALLGHHYNWDAVMAYRRGYTVVPKTDEDFEEEQRNRVVSKSKFKREMFTSTEATILIEAAEKIYYKKLTEQAHAGVIGNSFSTNETYEKALKPFEDRSK